MKELAVPRFQAFNEKKKIRYSNIHFDISLYHFGFRERKENPCLNLVNNLLWRVASFFYY